MNAKLFKKLNEKIEVEQIKNSTNNLSEKEIQDIETKVIFEDVNNERVELLNFNQKKIK